MSAHDELDRRLAAWMIETASSPRPTERFDRSMDATALRRPRPRWAASFGSQWVGSTVPGRAGWSAARGELVMAILVALLVVAVVGIQALGGSTSAPTHAPTTSPAPLPSAGPLAPGTYFLPRPTVGSTADYQRIVFTVPSGWSVNDGFVSKHRGQPDEIAFSAWNVYRVYADPCHWQSSTLSPIDLTGHSHDSTGAIALAPETGGLANQALRGPRPRQMAQVTLGGQSALRIDLSVPSDLVPSACDDGEFRSWIEWVADRADSHYAPGQLDSVYLVDLDRAPLVIDASHMPATSAADMAELDAILGSMVIDRGDAIATPSDGSTAGPSIGPSEPASVPDVVPAIGSIEPGTYTVPDLDGQGFNVRFTVPSGWVWDGRSVSKSGIGPPGGAAIFLFGGPAQVYADPCHWDGPASSAPPTGSSVADMMAALAAQASRRATAPVDRSASSLSLADRWSGASIELTVPDDIDFAACDQGEYRSWRTAAGVRSHQGPGQRDLVWIVDILGAGVEGGGPPPTGGLIIDAATFAGTPPDLLSEIDSILHSVVVGHWG